MPDNTSQILQTLETQLSHRLEKLWRVFDWCSKILISITAGVITASALDKFELSVLARVLVSAIIILITVYAWAWIDENLTIEKNIREEIGKIYKGEAHYEPLSEEKRPDKAKFGYKVVIILLGLIALIATWVEGMIKST